MKKHTTYTESFGMGARVEARDDAPFITIYQNGASVTLTVGEARKLVDFINYMRTTWTKDVMRGF